MPDQVLPIGLGNPHFRQISSLDGMVPPHVPLDLKGDVTHSLGKHIVYHFASEGAVMNGTDTETGCLPHLLSSAHRRLRLLIVEDEVPLAHAIREVVEDLGHTVCAVAHTEADALTLATEHRPDVALMDVRLGRGGDGIAAARRLHSALGIRSIYLSGYADHSTMGRITETYPLGVVHKPFSSAQLKSVLDLAARRLKPGARPPIPLIPE